MNSLLKWVTLFSGLFFCGGTFAEDDPGIPFRELINEVPGFEIKVWTDRTNPIYAVGERLRIQAKSNKDCFLYVFHIGASGKCGFIFPNAKHPDCRVTANQVVTIPGRDSKVELVAAPPVGAEVVLVIATTKPIGVETAVDERKLSATLQRLSEDLKTRNFAAIKDFVARVRDEVPNGWVGTYVVLKTVASGTTESPPREAAPATEAK